MEIKEIFLILTSVTGVTTAIIFVGKTAINAFFNAGIERYKNELNLSLEKFKSERKIAELDHQIRYSKLHEDRAQTIKELYGLLIDLQGKLEDFTSMFQGPNWSTDTERETEVRKSHTQFVIFYQKNRIYFSISLCSQMTEIETMSWGIIIDMSVAKDSAAYWDSTGQERASTLMEWRSLNKKVKAEINRARIELEAEFRKLIGVE